MTYRVTEPHPSVRKNQTSYIQAGRGGAGNYARYSNAQLTSGPDATGPASRTKLVPPPTTHHFTTGRGGAGNTFRNRSESPRRIFSFDEELKREQRIMDNAAKAPVFRIGRGGAGNMVNDNSALPQPQAQRRNSQFSQLSGADLSRTTSAESNASSAFSGLERPGAGKRNSSIAGTLARLGRTLSRN